MSTIPSCIPSIISRSFPRTPLANTSMRMAPSVRSSTSFATSVQARWYGCVSFRTCATVSVTLSFLELSPQPVSMAERVVTMRMIDNKRLPIFIIPPHIHHMFKITPHSKTVNCSLGGAPAAGWATGAAIKGYLFIFNPRDHTICDIARE